MINADNSAERAADMAHGASVERAAVVGYLREAAKAIPAGATCPAVLTALATAIEFGVHVERVGATVPPPSPCDQEQICAAIERLETSAQRWDARAEEAQRRRNEAKSFIFRSKTVDASVETARREAEERDRARVIAEAAAR